MEPRHARTHMTAHTRLRFFRPVNWYCSVFHSLTPDAQSRTGQSSEVTVDGTRDPRVVDWTRTTHTSLSQKMVEIARTVRRLPLNQRVDVSLLKRVKGLPWDGQGLVRSDRHLKLVLAEPLMAEAGETLRMGGSSLSGTHLLRDG